MNKKESGAKRIPETTYTINKLFATVCCPLLAVLVYPHARRSIVDIDPCTRT